MNSETELYKNRQWLIKKYVNEGMTLKEIADICKVDANTIYHFFKKFNIPPRQAGVRPSGYAQFQFRLPQILFERLNKYAKKKDKTLSEICRKALWDYLLGKN